MPFVQPKTKAEMDSDDEVFFTPLPLERQETIYEDVRISKTSINKEMELYLQKAHVQESKREERMSRFSRNSFRSLRK